PSSPQDHDDGLTEEREGDHPENHADRGGHKTSADRVADDRPDNSRRVTKEYGSPGETAGALLAGCPPDRRAGGQVMATNRPRRSRGPPAPPDSAGRSHVQAE